MDDIPNMDDIPYEPGDLVTVSLAWQTLHPETPLPIGSPLEVGSPGMFREKDEVPILYNGELWYVPKTFVRPA